MQKILRILKNKIWILGILLLTIFLCLYFTSLKDSHSEYVKEQLQTAEFQMFEGCWKVDEYLDFSAETHETDTNSIEYLETHELFVQNVINDNLDSLLIIDEDNIYVFGPSTELGYNIENFELLFAVFRQPATLNIKPPFVCAYFKLQNEKSFNIIIDAENNAILCVDNCFFRLEKMK